MAFVFQSRVRFVDTDASSRIHYSAMLRHLEAAEQEFLRSLGFIYVDPHTQGYGYPRVHVECDYTSMVAYDDLLAIEVRVDRIGRASFKLAFEVNVEGRHVARGNFVIACVDFETRRSRPLPEDFVALLKKDPSAAA